MILFILGYEPCRELVPIPVSHNQTAPFIDSVKDNSVYMFQRIKVGTEECNHFYDSGCGDFVSRYSAINRLGPLAIQTRKGPLVMHGVGDLVVSTSHGMYGVQLPLADGGFLSMNGMCLEKITETFPEYPLTGRIEETYVMDTSKQEVIYITFPHYVHLLGETPIS